MNLDGLSVEIIGGVIAALIIGIFAYFGKSKALDKTKRKLGIGYNKELRSYFHQPSLEEQIPNIKILFIDDEDVGAVETLKDNGYNVTKWEKVKDYKRLVSGEFDIIVLDINGVALHLSEDDGFGILKGIKRESPYQIVVAFSAKSYDLSKQEFFELADSYIFKPSSFMKIKTKIDTIIGTKLTVDSQIKRIENIIIDDGNSQIELLSFKDTLAQNLSERSEIDWQKLLSFTSSQELKHQVKTTTKNLIHNYKI